DAAPPASGPAAAPATIDQPAAPAAVAPPAEEPTPSDAPLGSSSSRFAALPAPAAPSTPLAMRDGTPLAIASSTAAGALLMRNLGLIGLPQLSAQVLIGGAGAVIGFGTSWGLSRFGFRPDFGQAVL